VNFRDLTDEVGLSNPAMGDLESQTLSHPRPLIEKSSEANDPGRNLMKQRPKTYNTFS
jgi:hypothetical protein